MATARSPIKVYETTKERIRHAALLNDCTQAELVDRAVSEYVERHGDDFAKRLELARHALLGGSAATIAHAVGASRTDIERIGGSRKKSL
jgi:hypothetical protein